MNLSVLFLFSDSGCPVEAGALRLLASRVDHARGTCILALGENAGPISSVSGSVPFERLGASLNFRTGRRFTKVLRDLRPELLHIWGWPGNAWLDWAACCHRRPVVLSTLTSHATGPQVITGRLGRRRLGAWVVPCDSPGPPADPVLARKRVVIKPAVPSGSSESHDHCAFGEMLGFPEDARFIVTGGRLDTHCGVRDALWAFDILRYLDDRVRLLVLGDGPELASLQRFARDIGVAEHVAWSNRAAEAINAADLIWCLRTDYPSSLSVVAAERAIPVLDWSRPGFAGAGNNQPLPVGDKPALVRASQSLFDLSNAAAGQTRVQAAADRFVSAYLDLHRSFDS